jgi:hypothetical protein
MLWMNPHVDRRQGAGRQVQEIAPSVTSREERQVSPRYDYGDLRRGTPDASFCFRWPTPQTEEPRSCFLYLLASSSSKTFLCRHGETVCTIFDEDPTLRHANTEQSDSSTLIGEEENHVYCSGRLRNFIWLLIVEKTAADVSRLLKHRAEEENRCSLR